MGFKGKQQILNSNSNEITTKLPSIYGGMEIKAKSSSGWLSSTLGIVAYIDLGDGKKLYGVTAAHGVGSVDSDVTLDDRKTVIGKVHSRILNDQSDIAFISIDTGNVKPHPCVIDTRVQDIGRAIVSISQTNKIGEGIAVHKSGISTDHTYGAVIVSDIGVTKADDGGKVQGTLTNYQSDAGDSGAPVFGLNKDKSFVFHGIHVSKVAGINKEQAKKLGLNVDEAYSIFIQLSSVVDAECDISTNRFVEHGHLRHHHTHGDHQGYLDVIGGNVVGVLSELAA